LGTLIIFWNPLSRLDFNDEKNILVLELLVLLVFIEKQRTQKLKMHLKRPRK